MSSLTSWRERFTGIVKLRRIRVESSSETHRAGIKSKTGWRKVVGRTESRFVSLDSPLEGGRGWMRPCSYMRSSLCPGDDPFFFVLRHHFTEMREKKRWIQTNWRTAHCTLTTAPRRSTCTMNQPPFFETPAGSAGGRGAGTGRGK